MKKELKITAVILAAILVFIAGFGLGSSKGITLEVNYEAPTQQVVVQSTAPATQAPETTAAPQTTIAETINVETTATTAASGTPTATTEATTAASKPSSIPSSKDEIVNKYVEVISAAKKEQNVTIHEVSKVDLECTSCSVSFLTGTVNSLLPTFMKPYEGTYTVKNGVEEGGTKTANDFVLPKGRDCTLTPAGIASATATPEGDGYTMTLKFVPETSTFDGTNSTYPDHHQSAMAPLNLATLELPAGAKITNANMSYSGATIVATVNGDGKLTKLVLDLPMEGEGTGKLGASLSVGIKGSNSETYEFTY